MTVAELREQLAGWPQDAEVRRHDSEYGAVRVGSASVGWIIADRLYSWVEKTEADATALAHEGESITRIVELR